MRRIGLAGLIGVGIMLGSATAGAQERGQFGLVMGYPTAVGVAWHATDRVGIKAEATFSVTSSEVDSGPFLQRDLTSGVFGVGISGLFYAGRADNVSLYVSPRFGYGKATSEIEDGGPLDADQRTETSSYSFGGSFGVQYSPNRRVSLFGEVGLNYAMQTLKSSTLSSIESESSQFGVRSAVGIVLYFN